MSRKPSTGAHHDASASDCALHAAAVAGGHVTPDPARSCLRCRRDARNASRRRAVRA